LEIGTAAGRDLRHAADMPPTRGFPRVDLGSRKQALVGDVRRDRDAFEIAPALSWHMAGSVPAQNPQLQPCSNVQP